MDWACSPESQSHAQNSKSDPDSGCRKFTGKSSSTRGQGHRDLEVGTLTIAGDNGNNEIRIAPGLAGQIIVSETSGGTVNKSNNFVFDAASVKNIVVNPKMGHDVVHVSGVALTGYLSIDLSSGTMKRMLSIP